MITNRLTQYLRYHAASRFIQDIDPSYRMLLYVCDRFELNMEQRYWLAFIYALTYNGASTFYVYNEFPDFENLDNGRLERWWAGGGRERTACQTDRRWVRSNNLFVPAVTAYRAWVGGRTQAEHFAELCRRPAFESPEGRYEAIYQSAERLPSFGQFALFLYLEALATITDLQLIPTNLDLNQAWSCRYGLYYAFDRDSWVNDRPEPIPVEQRKETEEMWSSVRTALSVMTPETTVWQIETTLCAFRKFFRGKRYIGYYLDRQALEIAKMEQAVPEGVCWPVLWEYRRENLLPKDLAEISHRSLHRGLSKKWVEARAERTVRLITGQEDW